MPGPSPSSPAQPRHGDLRQRCYGEETGRVHKLRQPVPHLSLRSATGKGAASLNPTVPKQSFTSPVSGQAEFVLPLGC